MNFKAFLLEQTDRDDWVGDLARDMQEDSEGVADKVNYSELKGYLTFKRSCNEAQEAIDQAHEEFCRIWITK